MALKGLDLYGCRSNDRDPPLSVGDTRLLRGEEVIQDDETRNLVVGCAQRSLGRAFDDGAGEPFASGAEVPNLRMHDA